MWQILVRTKGGRRPAAHAELAGGAIQRGRKQIPIEFRFEFRYVAGCQFSGKHANLFSNLYSWI